MDLIDPAVDAYAQSATTPQPEYLNALADETRASLECPQMLTGPVEGRLLQTLVWATGARRVLEVGTYSGYSALSMAEALPPGGTIVTCELSEEHAEFARRHIAESPHADRIEVRVGPAADTIRSLEGPFDLVFIDADKPGYREYFHLAVERLAERGLIVLDNTLRDGDVLDDEPDNEGSRAMKKLNAELAADPRGVAVLLTVRDGVTLWRRAAQPENSPAGP
jgi:caffeoyl-CoA O-methyltransferase